MKICHSVFTISRLGAGLSEFVLLLSQNLATLGIYSNIIALEDRYALSDLSIWHPLKPVILPCQIKSFGFSSLFLKALDSNNPVLIHQHGLWKYNSFATFLWSRKHKVSRIISPHGMIEPWAWNHHKWKKVIAWYLWEKSNLETADAINVTSEQEMNSVRAMGVHTPIAVIPIGIEMPDISKIKKNIFAKKNILFLSRIHPKKGLKNLINAWGKVPHDGWQITIVGPGEQTYINSLMKLVIDLSLEHDIFFHDAVYGHEKWQFIAGSDVFVLPSYSENFGIVIAEALACEVPVITTRATPWEGLNDNNCGWWIDIGVEPLVEALREAVLLPTEQLKMMGNRGRQYVEKDFNLKESTLKMKALYEWVLNKNNTPEFVNL